MKTNFFSLVSALMIVGVFVLCFVLLLTNLAENNETSLVLDEELDADLNNIEGNLSIFLDDVKTGDASLTNSSLSSGGDNSQNIILDSLRGIPNFMKNAPLAIYDSTIGLAKRNIFGDSRAGIILDVFAGLLVLAFLVAFVRWIVTGVGGGD